MLSSVPIATSAKLLLSIILAMTILEVVVVSSARIPTLPDFGPAPPEKSSNKVEAGQLSKKEIKQEMERQLLILQAAEENIVQRIRELQAQRMALSNRKRSHYNSMCLFNVVSCYRKRK